MEVADYTREWPRQPWQTLAVVLAAASLGPGALAARPAGQDRPVSPQVQEAPAEIARRLRSALVELKAVPDFEYLVVNDDLERCLETIRAIVEREDRVEHEAYWPDVEAYRSEIGRVLAEEYPNT